MKQVEYSKIDPLAKVSYGEEENSYYAVSFYDSTDNSINVCCSSQVGCIEKCTFCATGDKRFKRNLTAEEISEQFFDGINALNQLRDEQRAKVLYIIMEGMGEPSYNIDHCCQAIMSAAQELEQVFQRIVFRISTIGNTKMVDPYMEYIKESALRFPQLQFQFQLSLHTAFNEERKKLIPSNIGQQDLRTIVDDLCRLSDFLGEKLKCNYLLLNYPDGQKNYDSEHIDEITRLLDPKKARIKLTRYSDTGKGFSSPEESHYRNAENTLSQAGFEVKVRKIMGSDIVAACGMLHYEKPSYFAGEQLVQIKKP